MNAALMYVGCILSERIISEIQPNVSFSPVQFTSSPARLSIVAAPCSAAAQRARFPSPGRSSPARGLGDSASDADAEAKVARRRAEEAAEAQRRASSSYAAVRLPRAVPRPGTAVDAAVAAAAGEADVLVLFGRRWLPVRQH
jgi:hypothetical protein